MTIVVLAVLLLAFVPNGHAQSVGHVQGNSYVDESLHFAYSAPPSWEFVAIDSLNLKNAHNTPACYALFAARQPNKPFGIVAFTQKLNTPCYPGGTTYKEGSEFLAKIPRSTGPGFKELGHKHTVLPNGFVVDELDYMNGSEFSAGLSVNVGPFLVILKCNAASAADLATMTQSIFAIRKI